MSSKRGNQRRPARSVAEPAKKMTEEESAAYDAALEKRVAASIAADRERDRNRPGPEAAFAAAQARDHTLHTF